MKILVTGGKGFIGQYVQTRCEELGIDVMTYDIVDHDDVVDGDQIMEVVTRRRPDAIIHLAGMLGTHELWDTTDKAIDVNIKGALNVGRAALAVGAKLVSIEQPHIWYNVYEATKLAAKRMLTGLHYDQGLQVEFVTAHNAYGPGQHHGAGHPQKIIPTFATKAWLGEAIPVWGDGDQQVNLVYAGDVADMLVERAMHKPSYPHVEYQAGVDRLVSVLWVAELVNAHVGNEAGIEYVGDRLGEQSEMSYPEPNGSYKYKLSYAKLFQTIDWYKP